MIYINPLDSPYNAKGDGFTDDRLALQRAIDNACDKKIPLFIPPLTFYVSFLDNINSIDIKKDLKIVGSSNILSKIKTNDSPAGGKGYYLFNVSDNVNLTVEDVELEGPATIDISTNPNTGNKTAPTFAFYVANSTVGGTASFKNVRFTGKWFVTLEVTANGFGDYELTVENCDMNSYSCCIGFFSPLNSIKYPYAANRTLYSYKTRYRNSGIKPEENNGVPYNHTIYIHSDINYVIRDCIFDNAERYAIHSFSSGGKFQKSSIKKLINCYFSPKIKGGIFLSNCGETEIIDCKYYGSGPIIINDYTKIINTDIDPISTSFYISNGEGSSPDVHFSSCKLGRNARISASKGTWFIDSSEMFQGGPLPEIQTNTLANRPDASGVGIGSLYFDINNSELYSSDGIKWNSYNFGNSHINNYGATIYVMNSRLRGSPGTHPVNSSIKHFLGKTIIESNVFDGKYGGSVAWPIVIMPKASGEVSINNNRFDTTGDVAVKNFANTQNLINGKNNNFVNEGTNPNISGLS